MKKKMSILAALVLAVIVTGYSVSGTYAKYTSTFTGATSTAKVAKWAFKINDVEQTATQNFAFDLFETITENDATAAMDNEVLNDGTKNTVIAPGTKGKFDIKLANLSEVVASYKIELALTNTSSIPLTFTVNGVAKTFDSEGKLVISGTDLAINGNGAEETTTIAWAWPFETGTTDSTTGVVSGDAKDTELGINEAQVSIDAKVIVTQVD